MTEPGRKPTRFRWTRRILAVVLLLAVVLYLAGFLLPEEYEAAATVTARGNPEEVWAALQDHAEYPVGGSQVRSVEVRPDGAGWIEDLGSSQITFTTAESQPPSGVVWQATDSVVPMTLLLRVDVSPAEDGSTISAHSDFTVRTGTWHVPIFRWVLLLGGGQAGLEDYLRRVAAGAAQ